MKVRKSEPEEAAMWLAEQMKDIIDDKQRRMFNVGLADNLMDRVRQIQNRRLMTTLYGTPEEDLDGDADRPEHTAEQKKELLLQFTERDLTTALNSIKAAFDASMEDDDDETIGHAPEPKFNARTGRHRVTLVLPSSDYDGASPCGIAESSRWASKSASYFKFSAG